ncbi:MULTISPECIES: hypothetical protein [unclassified Nostoc]|uniref:hypothetical protein n=1 Tax=unclassified Nostoc TaxID=2593658 RepID=UPI002604DD94|nr:hypothetical protein [Nostoc sp. S13]MDF5736819.1 hypothetical protein [Nostoc sp. S13]
MAIALTSLAYQQLSQYLGIHLTAFLPRFLSVTLSEYHDDTAASAIAKKPGRIEFAATQTLVRLRGLRKN